MNRTNCLFSHLFRVLSLSNGNDSDYSIRIKKKKNPYFHKFRKTLSVLSFTPSLSSQAYR